MGSRVLALAAVASLSAASVADADERTTVRSARAVDRTCHAKLAGAGAHSYSAGDATGGSEEAARFSV